MVSEPPCTVGFVQGLRYDRTQKEMQAAKRTQWEFCLTQNKPVCKQDWQMSHHLYQIWKVNHKSQQVAFNQHTDVITVIVVCYYSRIGFYFPFSFNSMFVSVSFESGFISMLFLFVSVLILVFEASATLQMGTVNLFIPHHIAADSWSREDSPRSSCLRDPFMH